MRSRAFLVVLLLVGQVASAQEPVDGQKAAENGTGEAGAEAGYPRLVGRAWWNNDKKIELLELEAAQREAMDALMIAFLEDRTTGIQRQNALLAEFGEALVAGDEAELDASRDALAEASGRGLSLQLDMMRDVLALLEEGQRAKLREEFPGLFSRLWLRNQSIARARMNPRQNRNR